MEFEILGGEIDTYSNQDGWIVLSSEATIELDGDQVELKRGDRITVTGDIISADFADSIIRPAREFTVHYSDDQCGSTEAFIIPAGTENEQDAAAWVKARKLAISWIRGGDWEDDETSHIAVYYYIEDDDTTWKDCGESVTVTIQPIIPDCTDGQRHDWQSPYELLGGLKENPGVRGKGGGVVCRKVCAKCGMYRTTDTWASNGAEQGFTSISYDDADEESERWIYAGDDEDED